MFNTLFEHLFASQSPLTERRQPHTCGLREAFKEPLGGGVSMPSTPLNGVENTSEASIDRFPPT